MVFEKKKIKKGLSRAGGKVLGCACPVVAGDQGLL